MYPPSKRKSSKYERGRILLLVVLILPTVQAATAIDARSQPAIATNLLTDAHAAGEEIPTGFKLERYASVWEHNPFTLVAPAAPEARHSPFDKLFLTSWLKDGRRDVVFIQNSETNEAQKITAEPNEGNLRLIALHLDSNPHSVEAVISDGKEEGPVKFRFDVQPPSGQTVSPSAQMTNASSATRASYPPQAGFAPSPRIPGNMSNAQTPALPAAAPVDQPPTRRGGSANPKVQFDGRSGPASRRQGSEGVHLPPPRTSG